MTSRLRAFAPLCLACVALALALAPSTALALQPGFALPDLVSGVVVSVESRLAPDTGVIVTDVRVLENEPGGGTALTSFAMEGGQVGTLGMWSEQYAEMQVGDSVVARVKQRNGKNAVVAAPMVDGALADSVSGVSSASSDVSAGYIWEGLHWSDSSLPVSFRVNPSGLPAGAATAIAAAAQTWENDSGSHMDFTDGGTTGTSSEGGLDGVNVIGSGSLDGGVLARCRYWFMGDVLVEFDITYNTATYSFATNGSPTAYDVQGIGTHELGHTLVLLDLYGAGDSSQVMYYSGYPGDAGQRSLAYGDIAGIRAAYPGDVNVAPSAQADTAVVAAGSMLSVAAPGVLGNDTDADGDPLTASRVTNVSHGTLSLSADGSFTYTPVAGYSGPDSFTYRVHDGAAYSNTVTVSITVTYTAVNRAPVAADDVATVAESGVLEVAAPGVRANDTDADGDALTVGTVTDVAHGTLDLAADGSYTYTPEPGLSGTDTFTYRAFDGAAYSAPARVTITITPGAVPPSDTTAPLTKSDRVAYYAASATIHLTPADDQGGSGVESTYYTIDGGAAVEGTTVVQPAAGMYVLEYWSVDEAGNVEAPHMVEFTVITPPSAAGTPSKPAPITTLRHGKTFKASGYVSYHAAGTYPVTMQFYRYQSGHWVLRKSVSGKASTVLTFSRYSRNTSVPYSGKWRVRARHKVGSTYRYSGYRYFTAS